MRSVAFMRLCFTCLLMAGTFAMLEICLRLSGYSEHYMFDPIYTSHSEWGEIPYAYKPNLQNALAMGGTVINTDSLGLRAKVSGVRYGPKPAYEYRIAIAGDSVTFGTGVKDVEDTFARVLEKALNNKQGELRVRVFNYGVGAYSVKEMASTLRHRMLAIEPDLVMIAIIPEDFNLDRTPMINLEGYVVSRSLGKVLSPDSNVRRLLRHIHSAYFLRDIGRQVLASENAVPVTATRGYSNSYPYLLQFTKVAREHQLASLTVLLPTMQSDFGNVPSHLYRDQIPFLDLSRLRNEFTDSTFKASRFDGHPSAAVHHRIGAVLAEYVQTGRKGK
jgi:hypothetical protein